MSFISDFVWKLIGGPELPPDSGSSHYWVKGEPVPEEDVPIHYWMVKMRCAYCDKVIEVYHHVTTGEVAYHYRADRCPRTKRVPV
jgi:hypothetical protein